QKILDNLKKFSMHNDVQLELAVDAYYSLYLPFPILEDVDKIAVGNRNIYEIIRSALEDSEFRRLRYYTIADAFASVAIGTLFLLNLQEELKAENEQQGHMGRGRTSTRNKDTEVENGSKDSDGSKSSDLKSIVRNAVKKTVEHSETIKELQHFTYGYRAGVGHTLDLDEDVNKVLRLVRNTDIKKILMFLTKMPNINTIVKKKKVGYQRGEVEGYTIGSDIERIVSTELAYPSIYIYIKIAENKLLLYNKVLYMSLGPIYVLIDKSGSMDGNKILWAKATALALLMRSRIEKRAFYIRFFDSEPYKLMRIKPNAKPSEVLKVVEYVAMVRNGGGTDISKSVITACNDIMKFRSRDFSDIIIITDGEDRIAKSLVKKSLAYSRSRLISVMIMGDNSDLKEISYKYLKVVKLSEKEMLNVIEA
ncbi:MAG: VWA domain-containing protein, partial [Ignisphaera sp.]